MLGVQLMIVSAMKTHPIAKRVKRAPPNASTPRDQSENSPPPSPEEVAFRAYLNFQNHGAADGHDVEDWLRAEAELMAERRVANSI
jgi:hypothetical protein